MKIKYSNEADILLIEFKEGTPVDSIDLKEGIVLHLDSKGVPIEMEILDASDYCVNGGIQYHDSDEER